MSDEPGTLRLIAEHLSGALAPVAHAFRDEEAFRVLMGRLGWEALSLPPSYAIAADRAQAALDAIEALAADADIETTLAAIRTVGEAYNALNTLPAAPPGVEPGEFLAEAGRRLFDYLLLEYFRVRLPRLLGLLEMLGVVAYEDVPRAGTRPGFTRHRLDWQLLPDRLTNIESLVGVLYGWGTSDLKHAKIIEILSDVLIALGLQVSIDRIPQELGAAYQALASAPAKDPIDLGLTALLFDVEIGGEPRDVGLRLLVLPAEGDALPGLIIQPVVPEGLSERVEVAPNWTFFVRAGTDLAKQFGIVLRPGEIAARYPFAPGTTLPSAGFGVSLSYEGAEPILLFGNPQGTRLEGKNAKISADLDVKAGELELKVGATLTGLALVIQPDDAMDSFLGSVLEGKPLRIELDAALGWSSKTGLDFMAGGGFEVTASPHLDARVVRVDSVTLAVRFATGPGAPALQVRAGASFSGTIGPVAFVVDRLGIQLPVKFAEGNAGPFDVSLEPLWPTGLGLAIDSPAIVGGGYLSFDPEKGEYGGVLQVEIVGKISVKAFGLLSTKLPDGVPGYALIVFITAEDFQPIQLGMGFKLEGIGGMFAVNRTFDEVATREGLKNNTFATLLFPQDPVANAPQILRNLSTTFPIKPGSYLFGPMAKIGWATPTLITMDLALILEFGLRRRLIVLGRISSMLPNRDEDLIRLNMDAMGVLDMDDGTVALDAVLVDSRLLQKFVLTGSMAMRACLVPGPQAGLCLAVGGVNPHFTPPANMPKLDRITINLTSGENPRFTCDAYFAVTANTQQFGSRSSLYAAAYGFSIEGEVSFDVLMRLLPFHFIADFLASIQLKHGSTNLFKVKVEGELDGPLPLHLTAKATFEILCCDYSVHFDKTLFAGDTLPLPPAVDALEELKRALSSPENWSAQIPTARQHGVTTRKLAANAPLALDPLGQLSVTQSVLPLNTNRDIDTFGGAPISGARRFTITANLNSSQAVEPVRDMFAPAQFFDLSDDERLASPSFEMMDSGVVFGSNAVSIEESPAQRVYAPLKYDTIVICADGTEEIPPDDYVLGADRLLLQAQLAFLAKASIRTTGLRKFSNTRIAPAVKLGNPGWRIVSTSDLNTTVPAFFETFADASASVKALNQRDATATVSWQLLPGYETTF